MPGNNLFNNDEHAFDIEAPPILPNDDFGDNGDAEDSFMGGVEMDVNDENAPDEELEVIISNISVRRGSHSSRVLD